MSKLLTVDGSSIELEPNHSYVMGRSRDCDIVMADISASRRHARLTLGGEARRVLFIEDLGSRNGTYINEERIWDRTAITDGCKIRIGATVYVVALGLEVEGGEVPDTGTVAIEKLSFGTDLDTSMAKVLRRDGPDATNFAGRLETLGLVDVLQMLILQRCSGTLHLKLRGGIGSIELREGEVCSVQFEEMRGFDALIVLARENVGTFWLAETGKDCPNEVGMPSNQILVNLCQALDEG